ncbi:MAG: hypothetical protein AABX05_04565 [Nanoarchaeota archaeon]
MIALEQVRSITVKSLFFIVVIAGLVSLLMVLSNLILSPSWSFVFSVMILIAGMNLAVYLIDRAGAATLFYVLAAAFTLRLNDLGVIGWDKVLIFFIAGIIFEVIFLSLKIKVHHLSLDMVLGSSISAASVVIAAAFVLSSDLANSFPLELINLVLIGLASGLISSTILSLVWMHISRSRAVMKLQSYLLYF